MATDWKDMLSALASAAVDPVEDARDNSLNETEPQPCGKLDTLHVLIEKKGRNGKTATIIEGFTIPDRDVEEIAKELKKKIGTGGSSRGGEILLQGDWREKAANILRSKGFKVKGI